MYYIMFLSDFFGCTTGRHLHHIRSLVRVENQVELDFEYSQAVLDALLPFFPDAQLGPVITRAGSMVAAVPWINVPQSVLNNPTALNGFLPNQCFTFPRDSILYDVLIPSLSLMYIIFLSHL